MIKGNVGRRRLVSSYSLFIGHHSGKLGQELKAGPMREELCRGPGGALFTVSYTSQGHVLMGGTTHRGLGPPTSITKEKHYRLAHRPVWWGPCLSYSPLPKRL